MCQFPCKGHQMDLGVLLRVILDYTMMTRMCLMVYSTACAGLATMSHQRGAPEGENSAIWVSGIVLDCLVPALGLLLAMMAFPVRDVLWLTLSHIATSWLSFIIMLRPFALLIAFWAIFEASRVRLSICTDVHHHFHLSYLAIDIYLRCFQAK